MAGGLVSRRCVLFLGDLDPARPDAQYAAFKENLQRFGRTWGVSGAISALTNDEDTHVASWRVAARSDKWTVETEYRHWDWSDIARASLGPWTLKRAGLAAIALVDFLKSGTCWRYLRRNPSFGLLFVYPFLLVVIVSLLTVWLAAVFKNIELPFACVISASLGVVVLALYTRWIEPVVWSRIAKTWIFINSAIHLNDPQLAQRLGAFSTDLVSALKRREFDEVLVVAHGLGVGFMPVVLDRAFWSCPEFGKQGEKLSLLTLGSQLLTIGLHPEASWLTGPLSRVARDRMVYWLDYQFDGDVLGFAGHNAVEILTESKGRPEIRRIELPREESKKVGFLESVFGSSRRALVAQPRKTAFDFFAICCGPFDLKTRGRDPQRALDSAQPANA